MLKSLSILFLSSIFIFSLSSCAKGPTTVKELTAPLNRIFAKETHIISPKRNTIAKRTIGEKLILSFRQYESEGIDIKTDIKVAGKYRGYDKLYSLEKGKFSLRYKTDKGNFYVPNKSMLEITGSGENTSLDGGLYINNNTDQYIYFVIKGKYYYQQLVNKITYEQTIVSNIIPNQFQQTLVYNGTVKGIVSLNYQEFKGKMKRDAFSQDIKYDLAEGNIIQYKNAKIEVIEAKSNSITYKVLNPF